MVTLSGTERKHRNRANIQDESLNDTCEGEYKLQSSTSERSNFPNRTELTNAAVNNLTSLGILLHGEVDRYRAVLNNYDYKMLFQTFLYSKDLRMAGDLSSIG